MDNDDLSEYLNALNREDCYRVDCVLKESPFETTQQVSFVGANGAVRGPYIRKFIARDAGIGGAYQRLFAAQQSGRRFKYLPDILECYATADSLVVVMEYAHGQTLQDSVERKGASVEFARAVFPMLCDAVSELHEDFNPPIIHRDLKPSNVVLADGGLTIIDFGIARELREDADSDTTHFGTRPFAPPEQFGFGQTTERSDVYALGKILAYCITGIMPGTELSDRESAAIPPMLGQVISQATAFAPEMRFASARSLKAAFERAADSPTPSLDKGALRASAQPVQHKVAPVATPAVAARASAPGYCSQPTPQASPQKRSIGGEIWNVVVAIFTVIAIVYSIGSISHPAESVADKPLFYIVTFYVFVLPFTMLCLAFLVLDKRRLRVRFPWLAKVKWWYVLGVWFAVFVLSAFAMGFVLAIFR